MQSRKTRQNINQLIKIVSITNKQANMKFFKDLNDVDYEPKIIFTAPPMPKTKEFVILSDLVAHAEHWRSIGDKELLVNTYKMIAERAEQYAKEAGNTFAQKDTKD